MKVLFFAAWYPNPKSSLAGTFIREHAKAIKSNVEDLAVFHVLSDEDLEVLFKFRQIKEDGVVLYRVSHKKFGGIYSFLNVFFYAIASCWGYYKTYQSFGKADINHVHVLTRTAVLPYILRAYNNTPYVLTEHWTRYLSTRNSYKGVFRKFVTKEIVKRSSGLSTVSMDLLESMEGFGLKHENAMLISNTVSNLYFNESRKKPKQTFTFLHVSGLQDSSKNISGILRVVKKLKETGFQFNLMIVGDDIERRGFQDYCNKESLNENVRFLGKLYGANLVEKYQQSDAFILFSNFENQPCVLLESFASGLPVVATKVGGIHEIVNRDNGILINPKDEDALFIAMSELILGSKNFDSALIKYNAKKKYSYQAVSDRFLSFYRAALSPK